MKYFCSYIAWVIVAGSWGLALAGVCSEVAAARVGGWLFLIGKGVMLFSTLVAGVRDWRLAWKVFVGRYCFDYRMPHGWVQALCRFTWELPQTWAGYVVAQWRVFFERVDRVDRLGGVTFVTNEHKYGDRVMGMSIGCFANMWVPYAIHGDFEEFALRPHRTIFRHEYGHTLDSHRWGLLYLPVVGGTSLVSQLFDLRGWLNHKHNDCFVERLADGHAKHYFDQQHSVG